ncbi:MAG: CPBP family intramembrane metalloprotease [Pirellula sp.]|nr:CPBP family intramembrane metalloprotease [Pirellula sp.]
MKLPEDPDRDFPFYHGSPVALTATHWWFLLALVALAYALLIAPITWPGGEVGAFVPAFLFPVIPLAGLAWVSKGNAGCLFGKVGWREIKLMILFAILNIVITVIVGVLVQVTLGASSNPAIATASELSPQGLLVFLSKAAVQLVGEEVLTVIPMLALLHLLVARGGLSRNAGVCWAWLGTAILFALLHLSTYQWDFAQCILIIGTARLVLSMAYIKTKNLWVSAGAHILNDWILIMVNVIGSRLIQS